MEDRDKRAVRLLTMMGRPRADLARYTSDEVQQLAAIEERCRNGGASSGERLDVAFREFEAGYLERLEAQKATDADVDEPTVIEG